jgi:C4-dicarboxylate-specific signal transduction histidine kinase
MSDPDMTRVETSFQLHEAQVHLDGMLRDVRARWVDQDEDVAIAHGLGHILEHLNLAWHYRCKSVDQVSAESQEEFEAQCCLVPRLTPNFRLLEGQDVEGQGAEETPTPVRRWYRPWTWWAQAPGNPVMIAELEEARRALTQLLSQLKATDPDDRVLAGGLIEVYRHLNLAWHWRRKSAAHVASLATSSREILSNSVPRTIGTLDFRLEEVKA